MSVEVVSHESSGTALSVGTLLPQSLHLTRIINLVELEKSELNLLLLMFDLLWLGIGLLLPLFGSSSKSEHQVKSRLLLDVVIG
uniref:Uncharacterized protein n=1 Tax=Cannabis sativa TaxID=3483 RepID=A0A803R6S4_CANSA